MLARGNLTDESTLISERFATGFCQILYEKNCLKEQKDYANKVKPAKNNEGHNKSNTQTLDNKPEGQQLLKGQG